MLNKERETAERLLVISYDVYGNDREIETYIFDSATMTKEKACQLRESYESLLTEDCEKRGVHDEGFMHSFEEWVFEQGIWCIKVNQYRVEPLEMGSAKEYNVYCLEQGM